MIIDEKEKLVISWNILLKRKLWNKKKIYIGKKENI